MKILVGIGYAFEYIVILVFTVLVIHYTYDRVRSAFRSVFKR